jgi:gliding motility-associated-like protein
VATPTASTTYTLVLTESGCTDTVEVPIEVLPMPDLALLTSYRRGCAPFTVNFMDNSADLNFRSWNFGDGSPVSNQQNPVHTYQTPGTYQVSLLGVSPGGCKTTNEDVQIEVVDPGAADFTSNPGFPATIGLPATSINLIDQSQLAVKWQWEFGDGGMSSEQNPVYQYQVPGTYFVTLTTTSADGCVSKVQHGPVLVVTPDLFIPNVFSPNADGINDGFRVDYTGNQPFQLWVYDRWGLELFTSKDKLEYWTGVNGQGEKVPEGVYYYTAIIGGKEYVGNVTLLR